MSDLLQAAIQAANVPEVRELRSAAALRAGGDLPDVRERAAMRAMREDRLPDRNADALRSGLHRLHALLQGAEAVRGVRDGVEMAFAQKGSWSTTCGSVPDARDRAATAPAMPAGGIGCSSRRPTAAGSAGPVGSRARSRIRNAAGRCRPAAGGAAGRATGNGSPGAGSGSAAPGWRRRCWRSVSPSLEHGSSRRSENARPR